MTSIFDQVDSKFAEICSDVTLYSNPKGFFKIFAENVIDVLENEPHWLNDVFGKAKNDSEKIKVFMENKNIINIVNNTLECVQPTFREKNAQLSREKRNSASEALASGDYKKALMLCSQAVIKAPMTGQEELIDGGLSLAFALWLRSECLMKMGKFDLALVDLKLALKERLPAKQRCDYYWRMGDCYKGTGEFTRAKVSYDLALRLVGKDETKRQQLEGYIKALIEQQSNEIVKTEEKDEIEIHLSRGAKQSMPSLSRLVKVVENETQGRYAVAADDIKTGDILLVEKPYASCLLPDYYGSHCLNCYKRLLAPLWCPTCAGVAFCSTECQQAAINSYHKYECRYLDIFIGSGMSILSFIALRMVTQIRLETALAVYNKYVTNEGKSVDSASVNDIEGNLKSSKFKSRREKIGRSKKKIKATFEKSEVSSDESVEMTSGQIYSLCTHFERRKPKDYLKRILMAMFMLSCLKKSSYFGVGKENDLGAENIILEILLRNLQLLQFNAHEIYETTRSEKHKFNGAKALYVAVAIYPTGALFNHECYPAVARYFDGKRIILRAIRPIKVNEMIAENYGPQFLVKSKAERQRSLACRYWFNCQCKACEDNWPTLKQMPSTDKPKMKCPNTKCGKQLKSKTENDKVIWESNCENCKISIDSYVIESRWSEANNCISEYQRAASLMEDELAVDASEVLCDALDTFHNICLLPQRDTQIAQEALRACFSDQGNVYTCLQ